MHAYGGGEMLVLVVPIKAVGALPLDGFDHGDLSDLIILAN